MRLNLLARTLAGPLVATLLMLALAGVGTWALRTQDHALNNLAEVQFRQFEAAMTGARGFSNAHTQAYRTMTWIANLDEAAVQSRSKALARDLDGIGTELVKAMGNSDEASRAAATAIAGGIGAYKKVAMEALEMAMVDVNSATMYMQTADKSALAIDSQFSALVTQQKQAATVAKEHAAAISAAALKVGALMLVVSVLLSLLIGTVMARRLARELGGEPDYATDVAKRIAGGDLTQQVATKGNDTTSLLAAMKAMQDKLGNVVGQIRESTDAVGTASREIAQGNADLSQRTEEQASSLEETASSMEELTSTVKQNADNARQANQLAASASEVAAKGGAVVGQVVSTMDAISASSKKIADIISVIDGIAFQTNILALNAAVEAARAGEQGRGFAVVASEVRNLAQRSAGAAKEIKELITDSVGKVDSGTRLVADAGNTMAEVVASVKRVTDIMAEITAASLEQSSGIEQVNQAIVQMDQVTQQNAALVEESAAAAASMADQARELAGAVAVFKMADVAPATAARRAHATPDTSVPALPAAKTAAKEGGWNGVERRGPNRATNVTRPKFNSKVQPARITESLASDARRTGTDDSWAEF